MKREFLFKLFAQAHRLTGHRDWIRAGIASGYISLPRVKSRISSTTFLDADEEVRVKRQLRADLEWFDVIKSDRAKAPSSDPRLD